MTLDCTQLNPGDKVRLRNGEICTVETNDHSDLPIGFAGDSWYYPNGSYYDSGIEDPRDIVEILQPEQAPIPTLTQSICNRVITLTHDTIGYEHPDAIECNGKRYVPSDSPSLFTGRPFSFITRPDEGLVAIRYDDRLFTPAYAWPEPIKDRPPAEEDADPKGKVAWLTKDGEWYLVDWHLQSQHFIGWARTSNWKPKSTPAYTREEAIEELREYAVNGETPDIDLLNSIIAHLEAKP